MTPIINNPIASEKRDGSPKRPRKSKKAEVDAAAVVVKAKPKKVKKPVTDSASEKQKKSPTTQVKLDKSLQVKIDTAIALLKKGEAETALQLLEIKKKKKPVKRVPKPSAE